MFIPRILGKTFEEVNMTAVALVFVGITLILNGYLMWNKKETKPLIVFNLFTGGMIILFNIYVIMSGGNLVGAFGGLLFGLTNLLVAFDLIFKESPWATGNFLCLQQCVRLQFVPLTLLTENCSKESCGHFGHSFGFLRSLVFLSKNNFSNICDVYRPRFFDNRDIWAFATF